MNLLFYTGIFLEFCLNLYGLVIGRQVMSHCFYFCFSFFQYQLDTSNLHQASFVGGNWIYN